MKARPESTLRPPWSIDWGLLGARASIAAAVILTAIVVGWTFYSMLAVILGDAS